MVHTIDLGAQGEHADVDAALNHILGARDHSLPVWSGGWGRAAHVDVVTRHQHKHVCVCVCAGDAVAGDNSQRTRLRPCLLRQPLDASDSSSATARASPFYPGPL